MRRTYLVRHAKALEREQFAGDDGLRPLSPAGRRQAEALVETLATGETVSRRLFSSPARRCLETLGPYAEAAGLSIEVVEWLDEGSDPLWALGQMRQAAEEVVVACTHGDVVWGLIEWLARGGVNLGERPDAQKASAWVLDWPDDSAEGIPLRAGYLSPPRRR